MNFEIISHKHGTKEVIIDDEDFIRVNQYKWRLFVKKNSVSFYAKTNIIIEGKKTSMFLHRFILDYKGEYLVDHVNHNGLDCRKKNLRICTISENNRNNIKRKNGKTSKYKGVYKNKNCKSFIVEITKDKKKIRVGRFSSEIEAAIAYNEAAIFHFRDYANLNQI